MGFAPAQIERALEAAPDAQHRTLNTLITWLVEHPGMDTEVRIAYWRETIMRNVTDQFS